MADQTKIEWTNATWNPITGCSIVSPGCTNCYAMALAGTRLQNHESRKGLTKQVNGKHVWTGEVRFNAQWLDQPLRWTKPRMIFVCAHGDLFAEGVPDEWLDQIFAVMALAPQHTFQVLTKRPERMREYLTAPRWRPVLDWGQDERPSYWVAEAASKLVSRMPSRNVRVPTHCKTFGQWADFERDLKNETLWPLPNVWFGVSVEDQRRADERIPILLDTPAAIRWISAEPLLGPVDLKGLRKFNPKGLPWIDGLRGLVTRGDYLARSPNECSFNTRVTIPGELPGLDWVVAGGESGPYANPMHPDWARALRDQCAAAGVPFLFKQWGEWAPRRAAEQTDLVDARKSLILRLDGGITSGLLAYGPDAWLMDKVGKRGAGRLLDGVEHNAFPTTPQREEAR